MVVDCCPGVTVLYSSGSVAVFRSFPFCSRSLQLGDRLKRAAAYRLRGTLFESIAVLVSPGLECLGAVAPLHARSGVDVAVIVIHTSEQERGDLREQLLRAAPYQRASYGFDGCGAA